MNNFLKFLLIFSCFSFSYLQQKQYHLAPLLELINDGFHRNKNVTITSKN